MKYSKFKTWKQLFVLGDSFTSMDRSITAANNMLLASNNNNYNGSINSRKRVHESDGKNVTNGGSDGLKSTAMKLARLDQMMLGGGCEDPRTMAEAFFGGGKGRLSFSPLSIDDNVDDDERDEDESPTDGVGSSSHRGGESASGSGGGKKARKARTIFTDKQLQELEGEFDRQK